MTTSETPEATVPPPPQPPVSRPPLRRSVSDRKIAGVAGGLGRHFGIDPLIFRVVLVTLAVFGGSGLLLYAIGWLLVPEDGEAESEASRLVNGRATAKIIGAIILAVVGLALVGNFARTGFGFGGFAALVAVGAAAYLISRNDNRHDSDRPTDASRPAVPAEPVYYGPVAPGSYGQTTGTAYTASPYGEPVPTPPAAPAAPAAPRSPLGRITVSVALLVAGLLVSWNIVTDHDAPVEVILASCLGVVGLGLAVGAFVGRSRGLIALGAVLMIATSLAAVAQVDVRGGVGDRTWSPRTEQGVHSFYRLGVGQARLDLSRLVLAPGQTVDIEVQQGIGDMTITLPAGASADVAAEVHAGAIRFPSGNERNGTSVHRHYVDPRGVPGPSITIDAELGVGSLEVRRAAS